MRRIQKVMAFSVMLGAIMFVAAPKALAWGTILNQGAVIDRTMTSPVFIDRSLMSPSIYDTTLTAPAVIDNSLSSPAVIDNSVMMPSVSGACETNRVLTQPAVLDNGTTLVTPSLYGGYLF